MLMSTNWNMWRSTHDSPTVRIDADCFQGTCTTALKRQTTTPWSHKHSWGRSTPTNETYCRVNACCKCFAWILDFWFSSQVAYFLASTCRQAHAHTYRVSYTHVKTGMQAPHASHGQWEHKHTYSTHSTDAEEKHIHHTLKPSITLNHMHRPCMRYMVHAAAYEEQRLTHEHKGDPMHTQMHTCTHACMSRAFIHELCMHTFL